MPQRVYIASFSFGADVNEGIRTSGDPLQMPAPACVTFVG